MALLIGIGVLAGCAARRCAEPIVIANPHLGPMTLAVGPAVNLSGSADFDPDRFADLLASELSYAEGISVIPVSRTLGVLSVQGTDTIESPEHALELVRLLGADAILVFAVTEYDPYDPPKIGLSAQLFGTLPRRAGGKEIDPVALSRQSRLTASGRRRLPRRVLAQAQRVFDASHDAVVAEVRAFASRREADESPYGWRKYLVSQQEYIRFCSHAIIEALLSRPDDDVVARATGDEVGKP